MNFVIPCVVLSELDNLKVFNIFICREMKALGKKLTVLISFLQTNFLMNKILMVILNINQIEWQRCFVKQYEDQIYYPTYRIYYDYMKADDKILNFCQYAQFRFSAKVLFITEDKNFIINACSNNIYKVWDAKSNKSIYDFLNSKGFIN
jgi:predicted ribonuclease YlaK